MAAIQRRIGPNKVGYIGLLQPLIDGIKLILKESILPSKSQLFLFLLAPFIVFYLSLANWLFIPVGPGLVVSELDEVGLLFIIAITEISIFGVLYAGWSANSKYAYLGSLRSTAQMISYSLSFSLCLLSVLFLTGSLSLLALQQTSIRFYLVLPVIPLFMVCALAEMNRTPFDLPEAESELVAGFFTEHSAICFVYFFLGEYTSLFTICCIAALLSTGSGATLGCFLMVAVLWIRAVLPRYRFDQLLILGWATLLPFALCYCVILLPATLLMIAA